jgi:hypothetical protein
VTRFSGHGFTLCRDCWVEELALHGRQNDSVIELSTDDATGPIDPSSPASRSRCPKTQDVPWADSTGRLRTSMMKLLMGSRPMG